jgi:hypothetical protein
MFYRALAAERFEHLVSSTLLLGTAEQLVPLEEGGILDWRRKLYDSTCLAGRARILGAGEQHRQRSAQDDPKRNDIVVGDPTAELEEPPADYGFGVGRVKNHFRRRAQLFVRARSDADSNLPLVPERHDDARSNANPIRYIFAERVRESLKERERQRDFDEAAANLIHAIFRPPPPAPIA